MTAIDTDSATVSWPKPPGEFDYYRPVIQSAKYYIPGHGEISGETILIVVSPGTIPSSTTSPQVKLSKLTPGAPYRVDVEVVQGGVIRRRLPSAEFWTSRLFLTCVSLYVLEIKCGPKILECIHVYGSENATHIKSDEKYLKNHQKQL